MSLASWCTIPPVRAMEKLQNLHGMHDLPQEAWSPLDEARGHLREVFAVHGYRLLETPILEPTELFLRKSGGELAARMYTFTDPGGNQVSLRPEYTASIVRHYLEKGVGESVPVRIQYAGPVFRYEGDTSAYRQFTQVGAELLGSSDPKADVEILALSSIALSSLGAKGHHLEIGDLGVSFRLLESLGLSERAIVFILSNVPELKKGEEGRVRVYDKAMQLRLLKSDPAHSDLSAVVASMAEEEARELLHGLLQWTDVGPLGQREPSEVVERLLQRFRGTDDPARLQQGLNLTSRMAMVKGEPGVCLVEVREIIESQGLDPSVLDRLSGVMALLEMSQLEGAKLILDFGLARDLAYYTGIVFEIRHPDLQTSLGGGGRYDGLARALGSPSDIPALGFALTLESLLGTLESGRKVSEGQKGLGNRVLVVPCHAGGYREALKQAGELRSKGTVVEMEVCGRSLEESLCYARSAGIAKVISVDGDGNSISHQVG